jgi:RNA 3'-terminal phosphate cyclase (ATP)
MECIICLFEIDGSQKSGSGTILRLAIALAAIKGKPLHITNIRQNRPQPGLKPQHLESVLTAARMCDAELEGAYLNSRELWFKPKAIRGGVVEAEIGTAGSIPMLFMTTLPICLFAKDPFKLHVSKGGTDTTHAPTINYLKNVFLKALKRMGANSEISVQKYGYYPKGMGEATLTVQPPAELQAIRLENAGNARTVKGISVCTFLADRRVAERQAKAAIDTLAQKGYSADIQIVNDMSNTLQKGSSIALWAETEANVIVGADAIGELKKPAEAVGLEAANKLIAELIAGASVDTHLADMLIPYAALAKGSSTYLTRDLSEHLEANIWLAKKMLGAEFKVTRAGELYRIEKLAES